MNGMAAAIGMEFDEVTECGKVERKEQLKWKWAQHEAIVSIRRRPQLVAQDIAEHLERGIKATCAQSSREIESPISTEVWSPPLRQDGAEVKVEIRVEARSERGIKESTLEQKIRETLLQIDAMILEEKSE